MKDNDLNIWKPVGEMNDAEMAALAEDWDCETDSFLGYELKEEKKAAYERVFILCRELCAMNKEIEVLRWGIDNRCSHVSIHMRFSGVFLPMDKIMLTHISEISSLADMAVMSSGSNGLLLTICIRDIRATFVEFPENEEWMGDFDD